EYEDREDPEKCYLNYINKIYKSIDFSKCFLIIKMHPNDTVEPNIYKNQLKYFGIDEKEVLIIEPNNTTNVYDYVNISDLIISRSSTIMEESLLLKKKIIAFDLFEDGPSKYYDHLKEYPSYRTVIGNNVDLAKEIEMNFVNDSFNEDDYSKIVEDFTYKLDNGSSQRILNVFKHLSEKK
ncbi:CDP-glycerol glycerophosphotransferase family protein, partial [Winogradskyella sp.]|uniref:CDP-glycerol glycerophosphotransferase family protein n=1 Tax=Winogradskyella sp. TaxID=1883156 RepID=UPI0025DB0097